jgi:hypothetical protein
MPSDEMLVLASSKKWGGRCVAGISKRTGGWMRPVTRRSHGELTTYHCRIDGRDIEPLDVVRLEHGENLGDPTQPENVEVGAERWQLARRLDLEKAGGVLARHLADGPRLLGNRGSAIPVEEATRGVEASLALIRPESLELHLEPPREGASRPRPRARFALAGRRYDLALTDFLVAPRLARAGLGVHAPAELGLLANADVHMTVSLAEAREGWCTKLVAAVLFLPEAR